MKEELDKKINKIIGGAYDVNWLDWDDAGKREKKETIKAIKQLIQKEVEAEHEKAFNLGQEDILTHAHHDEWAAAEIKRRAKTCTVCKRYGKPELKESK